MYSERFYEWPFFFFFLYPNALDYFFWPDYPATSYRYRGCRALRAGRYNILSIRGGVYISLSLRGGGWEKNRTISVRFRSRVLPRTRRNTRTREHLANTVVLFSVRRNAEARRVEWIYYSRRKLVIVRRNVMIITREHVGPDGGKTIVRRKSSFRRWPTSRVCYSVEIQPL